jgi:uncharacterized protein
MEEFIPKHRLLLVSIRETIKSLEPYDATRYAWPVNLKRAEKVDLVLGCSEGIVRGVYIPERWLSAAPGEESEKNFPGFKCTHKDQRWGFEGTKADKADRDRYLNKRIPRNLRITQRGFRYS